jgi:hypothetical protein
MVKPELRPGPDRCKPTFRGYEMRDIRSDLQDRANAIKEQMSAAHNQFEKRFAQLKLEHQNRLKNPRAELEAVKLLMKVEDRRLGLRPAVKLAS